MFISSWRLEGSEFHAFGPAYEKARSPNFSFSFGFRIGNCWRIDVSHYRVDRRWLLSLLFRHCHIHEHDTYILLSPWLSGLGAGLVIDGLWVWKPGCSLFSLGRAWLLCFIILVSLNKFMCSPQFFFVDRIFVSSADTRTRMFVKKRSTNYEDYLPMNSATSYLSCYK